MQRLLRTCLLPVHRWTGLTAGLVLVLMALTGAATLFRPQLEPLLNRDLLTVPNCAARVPLDTLAANAAAAHPGVALDAIHVQAAGALDAGMPAAEVRFADQMYVYLNPCTGAVTGERMRFGGALGTIEQIHRFRFMEHGSLITGTCALLFAFVMALGGFVLWLPATVRGLRSALQFNVSLTGQARRLNLHKTIGVYAGLVILASALTGLPQAFGWYEAAIYRLSGSPLPQRPTSAPAATAQQRLSMEALWQRAQLLVPEPQDAIVHYPATPRDAVEWILIAREAPHPNARTMLYLDPATGQTIRYTPYAQASLGHRLFFWTLSWHTGQIGGWPGALLILAGALMLPVLAYTGISSYLRRKTRRREAGRIPVRVGRKLHETEDVCTLELLAAQGATLPSFGAGAHIAVFLGGGIVRDYSLCNAPRERDRYQIAVQRDAHSRGGSRALHDDIGEGDLIEIGAPRNHFPLAEDASDAILLAGGIGITPLLAMAEELTGRGAEFVLHYCTRSEAHTPFMRRIARAPYARQTVFHFSDGHPDQLLDLRALLQRRGPRTHLYVCGPVGFMTTAIAAARQAGWGESHIHKEFFAADVLPSESDIAFDVTVASSGRVVRVERGQTVLAALADSGVAVPSACRQGVCGTCITRVLSGQPEHRDLYLTADEHARNDQFAPCCSRARGMLVLDL